jgi:hypothetical protein
MQLKDLPGKTPPPTRGGARNPISFECERAEYKERRTGKSQVWNLVIYRFLFIGSSRSRAHNDAEAIDSINRK